jgi:hypothetical protein
VPTTLFRPFHGVAKNLVPVSDSGLTDIGINFFDIGLIRYRIEVAQSDRFLSDIGLSSVGIRCRISATNFSFVAPTYGYAYRKYDFLEMAYTYISKIFKG